MTETILEMRGLTRSFRVGRGIFAKAATLQAVAGIDLDVIKGEVLGIVGEFGLRQVDARSHDARHPAAHIGLHAARRAGSGGDAEARAGAAHATGVPGSLLVAQPAPAHRLDRLRCRSMCSGSARREQRRARAIGVMEQVGLPARFADNFPNQLSGGSASASRLPAPW